LDYVIAGANLKASIYGIPQNRDVEAVKKMIEAVNVPKFTPRSGVRIAVTDAEAGGGSNFDDGQFLMTVITAHVVVLAHATVRMINVIRMFHDQ